MMYISSSVKEILVFAARLDSGLCANETELWGPVVLVACFDRLWCVLSGALRRLLAWFILPVKSQDGFFQGFGSKHQYRPIQPV